MNDERELCISISDHVEVVYDELRDYVWIQEHSMHGAAALMLIAEHIAPVEAALKRIREIRAAAGK